jgi:hypothetical protein
MPNTFAAREHWDETTVTELDGDTLEQTTKAQRVSKGIALIFL